MFEIPALRNEFEQLCECFREWESAPSAAAELPFPLPPLFFFDLSAENSFCHLDLFTPPPTEDEPGVVEVVEVVAEDLVEDEVVGEEASE